MILLKVGSGVYVAADEVVMLQTYPSRPSRRDKMLAEKHGLYKDATTNGKRKESLRTLVHLKCGLVVGSCLSVDALAHRSPIAAPVKAGTRRNNVESAQILPDESAPPPREIPIERTPNPPNRPPKGTRVGESYKDKAEEIAEEAEEEKEEVARPSRLQGLRRLMHRD